jgi:beta-N-acetylhexosaminidase
MFKSIKYIFTLSFLLLWILIPNLSGKHHIEYVQPVFKEEEVIPIEKILLESMNLNQKVGQLFLIGFNGTTLSENTIDWIKNKYVGGVLLLGRNIQNEVQIKELTNNIQSNANIPLFVSIDQEGGVVSRIYWDDVLTTSQRNMESKEEAFSISFERGNILKSIGINMNLAPVVEYITDSNSFMYKRVFLGSKEEIAQKAQYSINGYVDSSTIPVIKHYPGHSNTSPDSHYYLPSVDITNEGWNEYIFPFKYLITTQDIDAVMVGHILFPNIDSKVSTISSTILTQKLKNELGFKGVVISDDMEMKAIKNQGNMNQLSKEALLAGIDILILSKESEEQKQVYEYIYNSLLNGDIAVDILDEKVERILKLKAKYNMLNSFTPVLSQE